MKNYGERAKPSVPFMNDALGEIDEAYSEMISKDKAKAEWKKVAAIELKTRIQAWMRQLKED